MKVHLALNRSLAPCHHLAHLSHRERLSRRQVEDVSLGILAATTGSSSHLNVLVRAKMTESIDLITILLEICEDDGLCRHIDTDRESLRSKEQLDKSLTEQNLYNFP